MNPGVLPSNTTFNHEAARENMKNKKFVKLERGNGQSCALIIDNKKVTYKGVPAELLSNFEKKKLENLILFMFLPELKQMPVIRYL